MRIVPSIVGLMSLSLVACTNPPPIKEAHIIKLTPPMIIACERMTIQSCQPKTNGELYECTLQISKNLALCADQTDMLIKWQNQVLQQPSTEPN